MNARKSRAVLLAVTTGLLLVAALLTFAGPLRPAALLRTFAATLYGIVPGAPHEPVRPAFAEEVELVFLIGGGATIILALLRLRLAAAGLVAAGAGLGIFLLSWIETVLARNFVDFLYPDLALALVFAAGAAIRKAGGLERKRLTPSLARRLPPATAREVARRPELVNQGGEVRTMTFLACGIRGFTQLTDRLAADAPGLTQLARRVMTPLAEAVLANGGTVDQSAPGKLTAFFNAPLKDSEHAVHGCACALRMTAEMEKLNRALAEEARAAGGDIGPIDIEVGLSTGPGILGNFGEGARLEYTVAGRAARYAEELKERASVYGFPILVDEATEAAARHGIALLEIDVAAQIDAPPAPIFAALGNRDVRGSPKFRALQTFHTRIFDAYRAGDWRKARELIGQCRSLSGASHSLYDLYLARVDKEESGDEEDWEGGARPAAL